MDKHTNISSLPLKYQQSKEKDMNYTHIKGTNNNTLILLHGTGGNSSEMIEFGKQLDPNATLIGIDGNEQEMGMSRYFTRLNDGSFNVKNLNSNTHILYQTITNLVSNLNLEHNNIILIGYSNGANIIQNLLKHYSFSNHQIFLLHPSLTNPLLPFKPQPNSSVWLSYGSHDNYIDKASFETIIKQMQLADIDVKPFYHLNGHHITLEEIQNIITKIQK